MSIHLLVSQSIRITTGVNKPAFVYTLQKPYWKPQSVSDKASDNFDYVRGGHKLGVI